MNERALIEQSGRGRILKLVIAIALAASMLSVVAALSMGRSDAVVLARSQTGQPFARARLSDAVGTTAAAPTPDGQGFWTVTGNGTVSVEGDAHFYGDASGLPLRGPIVGVAPTFDGRGYWLLGSDGGVFSYGDASFYGSTGNIHLNAPALQMVSTPDSRGYWFVAADGGVFSYGDARFFGSTGAYKLNAPVVGMADTRSGGGYWLVAADGGIFSFGDAGFHGSTGSIHLNEPMKGMASTSDSGGYWLVAADGGVFAFGDAAFRGSAVGVASPGAVVSIVATGDGGGYWVISNNGGIYPYGDAATTGGATQVTATALSPEYLGETAPTDTYDDGGYLFDTSDAVQVVNAGTYTQSVYAGFDCDQDGGYEYAEWNLGRNYNSLHTTIGINDAATPSNIQLQFQVYGDGNLSLHKERQPGPGFSDPTLSHRCTEAQARGHCTCRR